MAGILIQTMDISSINQIMIKLLIEKIQQELLRGDTNIQIEQIRNRNALKVTYTRNIEGSIPENMLVREQPFMKTINTYRHGKKSGMQIITVEVIEITSVKGDPADHPFKRPSATSKSLDDPAR